MQPLYSVALVTGGAGYIGSHLIVELLKEYPSLTVVSIDNYSNSKPSAYDDIIRVHPSYAERLVPVVCDIQDHRGMSELFQEWSFDVVFHLAGFKSVSESVSHPLKYWRNNVGGTEVLLDCMSSRCDRIVFSSSATVYGEPQCLPITEDHPVAPVNPYGSTKLACEWLIRDWVNASDDRRGVAFRYFNPIGAHPSGHLSEQPSGTPMNLLPRVFEAAATQGTIDVFGTDWDTCDGTGVRDYIHVCDLALGHVAAAALILGFGSEVSFEVINLGTGRGTSVYQIIGHVLRASDGSLKSRATDRRPGDVAEVVADCVKARELLGWEAKFSIEEAIRDGWKAFEKKREPVISVLRPSGG